MTRAEQRRLLERLERRTEKEPAGCWRWMGYTRRGYGRIRVAGKTVSVHRLAFGLLIGPVAPEVDVDHECHNADSACPGGVDCQHRRCWNPAHLRAATRSENVRAARARGLAEEAATLPEPLPLWSDDEEAA